MHDAEHIPAPVWTRLHDVQLDFSGWGDIRLPVSMRLDALGAAAIFATVWFAMLRWTFLGSVLPSGSVTASMASFLVWVIPPIAIYAFFKRPHRDGRSRLRRSWRVVESSINPARFPHHRIGRRHIPRQRAYRLRWTPPKKGR